MRRRVRSIVLDFTRVEDPDDPHAFCFQPQGYTLRGLAGGVTRFEIPWSEELLADIAALREPDRAPALLQRVGDVMQRALRPIGWQALAEELRAASAAGGSVTITLRSNAAELYALPWELLTVGSSGQHLGELPGVLVRHEWPETSTCPERPSPRPEGGRVLFAWSAAGGAVPAAEHRQALVDAWSHGPVDFDPAQDLLAHASPARLADALAAGEAAGAPFTVLHLLAHGGQVGATFGLALDGERGDRLVVDAGRLRRLLAPHAHTLRLVVVAACDSGNAGVLGNHLGSVAQALHRAGLQSVVASRFPLSIPGSIVLAQTLYRSLLVDLLSLESALLRTRTALARRGESLDWASLQLSARMADGEDTRPIVFSPFRGLLPFEARHSHFFFGRDADIAALVDRLRALVSGGAPRFLLVAGVSGSGKSSLVHAGLLPALSRGAPPEAVDVRSHVFLRPGERPEDPVGLLRQRMARARELLADPAALLYLVIDQFEELFTEVREPARTGLMRELWALAHPAEGGCVVLATVRIEFIGRFGELTMDAEGRKFDTVSLDDRFRFFVRQLDPAQVEAIIQRPALAVGLRFEEGLVARLVADVGAEPGALPLLSYTLDLLWQHRRSRWLPAQTYDAFGRLVGALTKTADELYTQLGDPARQDQARDLLVQLVHMGEDPAMATRRRGRIARLRPEESVARGHFDAVVRTFVDARLLVTGSMVDDPGEGEEAWVEVAHEALIRGWTRLQTWLRESREWLAYADELRAFAEAWSPHRGEAREADYLLTGTRLAYAIEMWSRHGARLGGGDRRLLSAYVERCVEQGRRRARNRRLLIGVIFSVLTAAAVIAALQALQAGRARDDAEEKARIAEEQTALAKSRTEEAELRRREALTEARRARDATRLSAARSLITDDPTAAALTLNEVESAEELPGFEALARSLTGEHALAEIVIEGGDDAYYAMSAGNGGVLAILYGDGVVRLWDANTGEPMAGPLALRGADAEGRITPTPRFLQAIALSHDGTTIATGTWDGAVQLWSADDGAPMAAPMMHEGAVRSVEFSADGSTLLSASWDRSMRLWSARTGEPIGAAMRLGLEASFSGDGSTVVTTFEDGVLSYSARTGEAVAEDGARRPARGDDNRVVMGREGDVQVWSAATGKPVGGRIAHDRVTDASLSSGGDVVITSSEGEVRLWRAETGELVGPPITYDEVRDEVIYGLRGATLSRDGERVLTWDGLGAVRIWRASTGEPLGPTMIHPMVVSAEFSSDGEMIATASENGSIRLWGASERRRRVMTHDPSWDTPAEEREFQTIVTDARLSADGERLVTASWDGTAQLWSVRTGAPLGAPMVHDNTVNSASFTGDGSAIVTASQDGTARLWDAETGKPIGQPMTHLKSVVSAEFSADGALIVTASEDGSAKLWSGSSGDPVGTTMTHSAPLRSAVFSADGRAVLTTSHDMVARVWSVDSGTLIGEPITHVDERVNSASFSPDGSLVATGSVEGTARLWDAATGAAVGSVMKHAGQVFDARLSSDGLTVATASLDGTTRLWAAKTGAPLGEPMISDEGVPGRVEFSPDGSKLLTSGMGDAAALWSAQTGAQVGVPMTHDGGINSAHFSADGRIVVTGSDDGSARLWDGASGESLMAQMWLLHLQANVRGCLPIAERTTFLGVSREKAATELEACEAQRKRPPS